MTPVEEVAKLLSFLGTSAFVGAAVVVAALWLRSRGQGREALVLLFGALLVFLGVHALKALVNRPRPVGGLVSAGGSSFPSGHAAYETVLAFALIAVARTVANRSGRLALTALAVALALAVGLTRVILKVHYFSDVVAGWALGVALMIAAGYIVAALRHNWPER